MGETYGLIEEVRASAVSRHRERVAGTLLSPVRHSQMWPKNRPCSSERSTGLCLAHVSNRQVISS